MGDSLQRAIASCLEEPASGPAPAGACCAAPVVCETPNKGHVLRATEGITAGE